MRLFSFSLVVCFVATLTASAQQPVQDNLDSSLRKWEKAMTELRSFVSEVRRTTNNKQLSVTDEFNGYAMFFKADKKDDGSRARLELVKKNNLKVFEKYICTGTFLYEYVPATNTIRIHNMPKNKKQGLQESFLSFLFGMGAKEAQARYKMEYMVNKSGVPDPHYHYIRILPKTDQDKAEFMEARLTLLRSNNLPAQIWYLQPNKSQITWDFTKHQVDRQIPLTYFEPDQPKGWHAERVPERALNVKPVVRK